MDREGNILAMKVKPSQNVGDFKADFTKQILERCDQSVSPFLGTIDQKDKFNFYFGGRKMEIYQSLEDLGIDQNGQTVYLLESQGTLGCLPDDDSARKGERLLATLEELKNGLLEEK